MRFGIDSLGAKEQNLEDTNPSKTHVRQLPETWASDQMQRVVMPRGRTMQDGVLAQIPRGLCNATAVVGLSSSMGHLEDGIVRSEFTAHTAKTQANQIRIFAPITQS